MLTAYDYTMARLLDAAGVDAPAGRRFARHGRAGPARLAARHARRDDLPHALRGARRAPQPGHRRHAVHELPGQPAAGAGERGPAGQGGRRARGQARRRRAQRRGDRGHHRGRHPGDGPRRPDAAVGPAASAASRCSATRTRLLDDALAVEAGRGVRRRGRVRAGRAGRADHRGASRSRPSASAPAPAATARCWSTHDMLGLFDDLRPKFVKQFGELGAPPARPPRPIAAMSRCGALSRPRIFLSLIGGSPCVADRPPCHSHPKIAVISVTLRSVVARGALTAATIGCMAGSICGS